MTKDKGKTKGTSKTSKSKTHPSSLPDAFGSSLARIGLAAIVILGTIIYSNSFVGSFHLDDMNNLRDNPVIRELSDIQAIWEHSHSRFLAFYSFAWNYHFGQLNVWGYHFVNLVIHLLNGILVYWLSFLIFSTPVLKGKFLPRDKTILSLAIALLFVAHPLATQSVTYIVQRMTSMSALFYLLGLVLYLMSRLTEKGKAIKVRLLIGAGLSALLAALTKENALTFPFAIVLLEICFLQTPQHAISFKDKRVLIIGAALLFLIAIGFNNYKDVLTNPQFVDKDVANTAITATTYLLTQFSVILKYIQLLFVPVNQVFDYNYPLVTSFLDLKAWLPFLALMALIGVAVYTFKKHRIISFGIFWFFLTLSIESSIIPLQDLIFEHRTYLPSFGFFLILVYGVHQLSWNKYKSMGISFLALLIVVHAVLAHQRNNVWKDEVTLYSDSILKSPGKARSYNNRGDALMDQKKLDEAFSDFEQAIALRPNYAMAFYNRGNVYKEQKKYDQAITDYTSAITLRPDFDKAYNNRGSIYKILNRADEALADFKQAADINPSYAMAFNNVGTIYMVKGQFELAIGQLNKAITLKPDFAEAFGNRGVSKLKLGQSQDGCMDIKKAADLGFAPAGEFYRQKCQPQ